jgi:hypothetical protein
MLNTIGDSLCHLASSNNRENGYDVDNEEQILELCKLNKDDEPCWVMGAVSH